VGKESGKKIGMPGASRVHPGPAPASPSPSPSPSPSVVASTSVPPRAAAPVVAPGLASASTSTSARASTSASPPVLALAPIDLSRWDRDGRGDLLAVHIWSDVRPLAGAAGLVDWRLCGKLSALMQVGRLTGADGEQLLLPTGGRLPWRFAMVMGLGPRAGFSVARFRAAMARLGAAVRGLDIHEIAVAPPGRDIDALPARRAFDLLVAELRAQPAPGWFRRLTVVETAAAHKELSELLPPAAVGSATAAGSVAPARRG
jgi:hypothetical protein